jgi:hypothetical protein
MNAFDHVTVPALVLLMPLVDRIWLYPEPRPRDGGERLRARARYALGTLVEWALAGSVLAVWVVDTVRGARSISARRSQAPAIGLLLAALAPAPRGTARRHPSHPRSSRACAPSRDASALLPRTAAEAQGLAVLLDHGQDLREILFRGLPPLVPRGLGVAAPRRRGELGAVRVRARLPRLPHVVRTAIVGGLLAASSPSRDRSSAMIVHAAMDLVSGDVGPRSLGLASAPTSG